MSRARWLWKLRALRPWRPRYVVVIVGRESGNVSVLSFLTFHGHRDGQRWINRMNRKCDDSLTRFELRELA